jgi:hypothetical protein
MGHGATYSSVNNSDGSISYNADLRNDRAVRSNYVHTAELDEIFVNKEVHNAMNPKGITFRESRYSAEHPNVVSILFALDVTGSMLQIPKMFIVDGLPTMMGTIVEAGVADPQLMFVGIGDHVYDHAPLQVGQFETTDELIDKWLTSIFLEGRGGGNEGESYLLAWYFAAKHTVLDSFEKDKRKGFLFTMGDEPCLDSVDESTLTKLMGPGEYSNFTAKDLLKEAQKTYNVYHIHIRETPTGSRNETVVGWRKLLGENCIPLDDYKDAPKVIADIILKNTTTVPKIVVTPLKDDKPPIPSML